jgi:hypothetical protein
MSVSAFTDIENFILSWIPPICLSYKIILFWWMAFKSSSTKAEMIHIACVALLLISCKF